MEYRTTEVCLKEVDMASGDVKLAIDKMKELGAGASKSKTLPGLLANWLLKYLGVKMSRRQVSKNNTRQRQPVPTS